MLGEDVKELFKVNYSISVFISIVNHLINFGNTEILSNTLSDFFKFFWTKGSVFIDIKEFKKLTEWGFTILFSTESKDFKETCEIHFFSIWWSLNDVNNLLSLIFNTKSSDGVNEFISWDISASIIIKNVETFFKSKNSFFV